MHCGKRGRAPGDLIDNLGVRPLHCDQDASAAAAATGNVNPDDGSRRPTRSTRRGNRNQQSPPPRNRSAWKTVNSARRRLDPAERAELQRLLEKVR